MGRLQASFLIVLLAASAAAQSPDPPLADTRLTVHTLLREDAFAGFMANDLTRLARAERNIETLLRDRPGQRGNLMAWRGLTHLTRAVHAHEAGQPAEFQRHYAAARAAFADAARQTSGHEGAVATTGGSWTVFADRLPPAHRAEAWAAAYAAYAQLWAEQNAIVDKLPVHFRGELLAGLAQTAQRTGRLDEMAQHLDRMLTHLAGTPYEAMARKWKDDPSSAATTSLTCKSCHNPGRLSATLARQPQ